MQVMIKNKTDLSIDKIGALIKYVQDTSEEETHYVGQIQRCKINCYGTHVDVQIRILSKYIEWTITPIKAVK